MIEQIYNMITQLPESVPVAALFLGLFTALNPCQLAISMSALAFLTPHGSTQKVPLKKVFAYVMGRCFSYIALGWILKAIFLLTGTNDFSNQWKSSVVTRWIDIVLPYVVLAIAMLFLWRAFRPLHKHDSCHNSGPIIRKEGHLGAFFLGVILAFAFCPESAVFYFGCMMPMALNANMGWFVPVYFALAAAVPVILFGVVMIVTADRVKRFSHVVGTVQRVVNAVFGVLCLGLALWVWFSD